MYIVIELQTSGTTTTPLTYVLTERDVAEQKFHEVLSYAAVSTVDIHGVTMLNRFGQVLKSEVYNHTNSIQE